MCPPKLNAAQISRPIQSHPRPTLFHPKRITHHRNRRHRRLDRLGGVHAADHAPVGGGVGAFFRQLFAAVEDDDEVIGHGRVEAFEPAHQHGQFVLGAGFVVGAQQVAVGVGDRRGQAAGAGPVAVDVQFAERGVAVEDGQRRDVVEVALELLGRDVLDGVAARFAREQAGAGEVGEDDGHGGIIGQRAPARLGRGERSVFSGDGALVSAHGLVRGTPFRRWLRCCRGSPGAARYPRPPVRSLRSHRSMRTAR